MKHPPKFTFTRIVRTMASENHVIRRPTPDPDSNDNVGYVDLHFEGRLIHGTLVLEVELHEGELDLLIDQMTDQLVPTERDDFIFSVYLGSEIGHYSDSVSEFDRAEHSATKGDLSDIRATLAKVIGSHQVARGKLAEHATSAYFESLGYRAKRAGPELDALKIDVVAESESEIVFVKSKLGAISAAEMRKFVVAISRLTRVDKRKFIAAIVARTFPKDSEQRRRHLEAELGVPIMCIQTYQVALATPEYRHALGG